LYISHSGCQKSTVHIPHSKLAFDRTKKGYKPLSYEVQSAGDRRSDFALNLFMAKKRSETTLIQAPG